MTLVVALRGAQYERMGLECCEGVSGVWHYHLRHPGKTRALCGAFIMHSERRLSQWGIVPPDYHIPESFCSACEKEAEP